MNDKRHTESMPDKAPVDIGLSEKVSEEVSETSQETALEKEPSSKKKSRRWPFFVLAFIVGSATSIFTLNYYQLIYHTAPENTSTSAALLPVEKAVKKTLVDNIPIEAAKKRTEAVVDSIETPIEKKNSELPKHTAISSEEGEALISAIKALQSNIQELKNELQTLHLKQRNVADSQAMLESMQLRSRLTKIIQHNSHLPQITWAWQEISLLPSLSTEQRALANSMLQLAQKRQNDVLQWQQTLSQLIASLKPNEHNNIISNVVSVDNSNPLLQWLMQQFSLKRSQSSEERLLLTLKNRLVHIKQGMALEQWPTAWPTLRAQLQLHLVDQVDENTAPSLQLPENFTSVQADVEQLRQAAKIWLEGQ
ncbi:MAG: hypothetical protein Q9M20_01250 [Mariprofundaceae bacterium]|nr:hypothetical protein [Mariprofundaceae bacterium]